MTLHSFRMEPPLGGKAKLVDADIQALIDAINDRMATAEADPVSLIKAKAVVTPRQLLLTTAFLLVAVVASHLSLMQEYAAPRLTEAARTETRRSTGPTALDANMPNVMVHVAAKVMPQVATAQTRGMAISSHPLHVALGGQARQGTF